jgi:hypothetical protein
MQSVSDGHVTPWTDADTALGVQPVADVVVGVVVE